jgi:peptidoglycan/xylan/chitin deacetylase (PgdA/CDA1 family)
VSWLWIAAGLVAVILIVGGALRMLLYPPGWLLRRVGRLVPGALFRVNTMERVIALTFDDVPSPHVTPGVLGELRKQGDRATFFVVGAYAEAHPELLAAIRQDGHELANHLYTDRMSAGLSDDEFVEELLRTDALIQPCGPIKWCRPGCGVLTRRMLRLLNEQRYSACLATAYPIDLYARAGWTASHFMDNVRPGAILVLHDGGASRKRTIETLAEILRRLHARGYRLVTLSELFALGPPVVVAEPPTAR